MARLTSVVLENPSAGLRIENAYAADGTKAHKIPIDAATFHHYDFLEPLSGADVPPGSARVIVLELTVSGAGSFTSDGIMLTYTVDSTDYQIMFPDLLRVCAPVESNQRSSDQPLATAPE